MTQRSASGSGAPVNAALFPSSARLDGWIATPIAGRTRGRTVRKISTGVEQLMTSDAIANAVLTYASALGRADTAATISVPIVRDDGGIDVARLLLGPASQLTIVPDGATEVELPGEVSTLEDLRHRIAQLEPDALPPEAPHDSAQADLYFPDLNPAN